MVNKNYLLKILKKYQNTRKKDANRPLVRTRFPPEPSGYMHVGHVKAALLNSFVSSEHFFTADLAKKETFRFPVAPPTFEETLVSLTSVEKKHFEKSLSKPVIVSKTGLPQTLTRTHLRFDDTNPTKASAYFVREFCKDLAALEVPFYSVSFSSDYFGLFAALTKTLIAKGLAFVDRDTAEDIAGKRMKGVPSDQRERPAEEQKAAYESLKEGEFGCVRLKLDMSNPNKCLRDPVIYRKIECDGHFRTGSAFVLYPAYDFVCPVLDYLEGVELAVRTDEYRDREQLYGAVLQVCKPFLPVASQYNDGESCRTDSEPEVSMMARLNMAATLVSKRKLKRLLDGPTPSHFRKLEGWTDPRVPTVRGLFARGFCLQALRAFISIGLLSVNLNTNAWDKFASLNKKTLEPSARRFFAVRELNHSLVVLEKPEVETVVMMSWFPVGETCDKKVLVHREVLVDNKDYANSGDKLVNLIGFANFVKKDGGRRLVLSESKVFKDSAKVTWVPVDSTVKIKIIKVGNILTKDKVEKEENFMDFLNADSWTEEWYLGETTFKGVEKNEVVQIMKEGLFIVRSTYDEQTGFVELLKLANKKA